MSDNCKRKADDNVIVDLNSVGLSLSGIAKRFDVHYSTITYRLKAMGIPPADTRHAFMEEIFESLTMAQQTWLIEQIGPAHSIKDFIRSLLLREYINRNAPSISNLA